ncbi:MAG: sulfotransferase [Bacteroidota bacterium]
MLKKFFAREAPPVRQPIIVVSGLPRSGTSMMMRMLEEGGLPVVTDLLRAADRDNPNGYYELETVKQLPQGQTAWLAGAQGRVVKVISALLEHLPPRYQYKVIFMERAVSEVLTSQQKMLSNRNEESKTADAEMQARFQEHVAAAKYWLARQPNIEVLYVDYNRMMASPQEDCRRVAAFLGVPLDLERMQAVPDAALYRNRASAGAGGPAKLP